MAKERRKDNKRAVLRTGELQRSNGTYSYNWYDINGKRHFVYGKTLEELRIKELDVTKKTVNGLNPNGRFKTLNDIYEIWKEVKRGLKSNTFEGYKYSYEMYVRNSLGKKKIDVIKKTDVRRFYNTLADERGLAATTLESVQSVIHQLFDMAIDDGYIAVNPSSNVLKEIKKSHSYKTEQKHGLTISEQNLFLSFLKKRAVYRHWYPIFAIMIGSGLRVGEITGLRWCDIDMDEGVIDVNHNLVCVSHRDPGGKSYSYLECHSPKTKASIRKVPMMGFVKEAFEMQREYLEDAGLKCNAQVDGYTDFIFLNKDGNTLHQGTLNKALKRIIRDCNDTEFDKNPAPAVLLPGFSCHSLRHTFTTRCIEAGVNVKVLQKWLGHDDITTTLNIYADCTKEMVDKSLVEVEKVFESQAV